MGQLIQLNEEFTVSADEFSDLIKKGRITHAVMMYRLDDGSLEWRTFGAENTTYLLGLVERLRHRICENDNGDENWME